MDQIKIGRLIAKLRKEKGMTQRELGDKVGVGFKAVSKWERGLTCPDISIINDLSKILGITSDELLTGELSKEHQISPKIKLNKKYLLIIPLLILIFIIILVIIKINNNRIEIYNLDSTSEEYYVEGKIVFNDDKTSIYIDKIKFIDKVFKNTIIKNYEYELNTGTENILSYGYISVMQELLSEIPISKFTNDFKINYTSNNELYKDKIINNGIILKIIFLDTNDNLIEKNIYMTLTTYKK